MGVQLLDSNLEDRNLLERHHAVITFTSKYRVYVEDDPFHMSEINGGAVPDDSVWQSSMAIIHIFSWLPLRTHDIPYRSEGEKTSRTSSRFESTLFTIVWSDPREGIRTLSKKLPRERDRIAWKIQAVWWSETTFVVSRTSTKNT